MANDKLEVRKQTKKKKPTFRRQQTNQFAKFKNSDSWRRPKGPQSKMRLGRKGHRSMPEVGFGSPKEVRGLNKDGKLEVVVYNVEDLKTVDTKIAVAIIGRTVGGKKRLQILEEAKKTKITIGNVKDIDNKIKELTKTPKKVEKKAAPKKTETSKEEVKKEEPKKETKAKEVTKK